MIIQLYIKYTQKIAQIGYNNFKAGMAVALYNGVDDEMKLLNELKDCPIPRAMLSIDEIKILNKLIKLGLVSKGTSENRQKNKQFYITQKGLNFLEEQ